MFTAESMVNQPSAIRFVKAEKAQKLYKDISNLRIPGVEPRPPVNAPESRSSTGRIMAVQILGKRVTKQIFDKYSIPLKAFNSAIESVEGNDQVRRLHVTEVDVCQPKTRGRVESFVTLCFSREDLDLLEEEQDELIDVLDEIVSVPGNLMLPTIDVTAAYVSPGVGYEKIENVLSVVESFMPMCVELQRLTPLPEISS
jgi:hypothetical protein